VCTKSRTFCKEAASLFPPTTLKMVDASRGGKPPEGYNLADVLSVPGLCGAVYDHLSRSCRRNLRQTCKALRSMVSQKPFCLLQSIDDQWVSRLQRATNLAFKSASHNLRTSHPRWTNAWRSSAPGVYQGSISCQSFCPRRGYGPAGCV
jgi:hypothetical protein